jgi:hypothetical protein
MNPSENAGCCVKAGEDMELIGRAWISVCILAISAPAQWLNYKAPNVPRLKDGSVNITAPVPPKVNGHADLSGVWAAECSLYGKDECFTQGLLFDLAKDLKPEEVQMTPWAAAISAQRISREHADDPRSRCLPGGVPRINFSGGPFKILQTPAETVFLYEASNGLTFRQVFTDGRPAPESEVPSWLGYSLGRWEGDTFVVDTTGFKDGGWLDTLKARPHSDALRVTERFHRVNFGHIEMSITINDPKAFLKPWTAKTILNFQQDTELLESFCDAQEKSMEHRVMPPPPPEPPSPPVPPPLP